MLKSLNSEIGAIDVKHFAECFYLVLKAQTMNGVNRDKNFLQTAVLAVAIGNASEEIKRLADFVTFPQFD